MHEEEESDRLVRGEVRGKAILVGLAAALVAVTVVSYVAGGEQLDGWLMWGVLASVSVAVIGCVIIGIGRQASGRPLRLRDLPGGIINLAAGLIVAYLAIAVTMVVT